MTVSFGKTDLPLVEALDIYCARHGSTYSGVIRVALREFLARDEAVMSDPRMRRFSAAGAPTARRTASA